VRVLQVTPYFAPAWAYGGPPRVMFDYASGLVALGHTVDVYTTDALDEHARAAPAFEVIDGVSVRRFPNLSNRLAWERKKYLPRGLLGRLLRNARRYDVVHVTDARTFLTAASHLALWRSSTPLVLSAHGSLPQSAGLRGVVKSVYDAALLRPTLRRSPLLLAQTDHERRLYEQLGGRAEAVKLLPLPLSHIVEPPARGVFRAQLGLGPDAPLLLFVGRINRLKGLDVLIESVAPLLADGAVLAIVGRDDGQLAELQHRFENLFQSGGVRFVGPLYGDERFAAYADADVFCLTPPHWEETSVAALEAAASGTAVVLTEQTDIPGIAAAGGGFVVPLSTEAIRSAVESALPRSEELGEQARAHVLAQHDGATVVEQLERHLEALV
jgi:glycosyltransferase involved in cell wall biosynthesis